MLKFSVSLVEVMATERKDKEENNQNGQSMLESRGISMYLKQKLPKGSDIIIVQSWKHPEWNDKFAIVIEEQNEEGYLRVALIEDDKKEGLIHWANVVCYSSFLEEHESITDKLEFGVFAFEHQIDPLFCGNCGKTEEEVGHKLKACKGCGGMKDCVRIRYCCKHCQKVDWKRHKAICKMVGREKFIPRY